MKLGEKDVRAMVRLVGEVAALPGGHEQKKNHLMNGLIKLIDADAWAWALNCQLDPTKEQPYTSPLKNGFPEKAFTKFLQIHGHPEAIHFSRKFYTEVKEKKAHLTRLTQQIFDETAFENSDLYKLWKEAGLGSFILSMRPLSGDACSTIGIYRRTNREKFTPRESQIAHIVLTEVPWLHEQGWPDDRGASVPALTKQQRLTLNLLIQGHNRKQMAANMNISLNTLDGYIKSIHRHFDVKSQAELMNRFYSGNGHDVQ